MQNIKTFVKLCVITQNIIQLHKLLQQITQNITNYYKYRNVLGSSN